MVPRLLQRRFRNRRSRQNKILERPQSPRPDAQSRERTRRPDRVEPRRLRPRKPRRSRIRRRQSRPAHQRDARSHRRPIRRPPTLRHHGRPRPSPRRSPPPRLLPLDSCSCDTALGCRTLSFQRVRVLIHRYLISQRQLPTCPHRFIGAGLAPPGVTHSKSASVTHHAIRLAHFLC